MKTRAHGTTRRPRAPAPPAPGLREVGKERRRRRIIAAARALFARSGYEATTTRAIAARAGVAAGTLFLYFPEKRDLLFHIFMTEMREVDRRAFAAVRRSDPIAKQLAELLGAFIDEHARDPRLSRVFIKEFVFVEEKERAELLSFETGLLSGLPALIAEAQAAGRLASDVRPELVASYTLALFNFALAAWQNGALKSPAEARAYLAAALDDLVRGVGPRARQEVAR